MSEEKQMKSAPYGWHVEWADSGEHYLFTKVEKRIEVLRLDSDVKVVTLYTHADPAEVERLRAQLAKADNMLKIREEQNEEFGKLIEEQHAKLAEAHALLRDIQRSHGVLLMTNPPQDPWLNNRIDERIRAALSASAEPKG